MGKLPIQARVEALAAATPEQVWAVLADVTRTGEWSAECHACDWLDGATEARPGARFRGRNQAGRARWQRTCEVVEAEPGRVLAWRTEPTRRVPDSTLWRIRLEPVDSGTRIVQTYDLTIGPVMSRLFWLLVPAHRDRTDALRADLVRLGEAASRSAAVAPA